MTWLRLLGDEGMAEPERGELWRAEYPDLALRVGRLLDELEAAGVDQGRWPYSRETAHAPEYQMGLMVLKATEGYEAVIEVLERRWARDPRNPNRTAVAETADDRLLAEMTKVGYERLIQEEKAAGRSGSKKGIADRLGVHVSTVKRSWREVAPGDRWPSD